jgi:transcription elongation factor GreA-like protein
MVAMKNSQKILKSLLNYLRETGIHFSWVSDDGMKDKAVTSFSLDLKISPCILCGTFSDQTREIISIAHEAGHILAYQEMDREESRTYLCSTFAGHRIGLNKISPAGQESMLTVEIKASVKGLDILNKIVLTNEELNLAKKSMSQWYSTYEKLCEKDVVTKVRETIMKHKYAAFLISQ